MHIHTYAHIQKMTSQLTDAPRNEGQHTDSSTREDLHKLTEQHTQVKHRPAHRQTHADLYQDCLPHKETRTDAPIDPPPWAESQDNRLRHTVVQAQAYTWRVTHALTQEHTQVQSYGDK